ncbi:MAG: energy transducer TonB [Deltaproteobacteria bacterium]|nr:energy transducer TonB [Deltaproteobacteria bacterium]
MSRRLLIAGALAAATTLGLFVLMQSLIARGEAPERDFARAAAVDFIRAKNMSEVETRRREMPKRPTPSKTPSRPAIAVEQQAEAPNMQALHVPMTLGKPGLMLAGESMRLAAPADTGMAPLVRVEPIYPPHAARNLLEGWVVVQFTITPSGAVSDPEVISADPPGVFDGAALQAVRKWRYKPRVEEGQPVATSGVQVKLTFKLEGN